MLNELYTFAEPVQVVPFSNLKWGKFTLLHTWIQNYTSEQVKAKLLAEAEHRPAGMSLGDFVYRRCRVYYDTMVDDVPAELDCRGHDENVIPFIDTLLET